MWASARGKNFKKVDDRLFPHRRGTDGDRQRTSSPELSAAAGRLREGAEGIEQTVHADGDQPCPWWQPQRQRCLRPVAHLEDVEVDEPAVRLDAGQQGGAGEYGAGSQRLRGPPVPGDRGRAGQRQTYLGSLVAVDAHWQQAVADRRPALRRRRLGRARRGLRGRRRRPGRPAADRALPCLPYARPRTSPVAPARVSCRQPPWRPRSRRRARRVSVWWPQAAG